MALCARLSASGQNEADAGQIQYLAECGDARLLLFVSFHNIMSEMLE
jgi:hypothetical protein